MNTNINDSASLGDRCYGNRLPLVTGNKRHYHSFWKVIANTYQLRHPWWATLQHSRYITVYFYKELLKDNFGIIFVNKGCRQQDRLSWWRHQMEIFSALLAICAGNSPVPGEFPTQRPVTRSFDVYFNLRPNKRLSKQSWGWWFEAQSPRMKIWIDQTFGSNGWAAYMYTSR